MCVPGPALCLSWVGAGPLSPAEAVGLLFRSSCGDGQHFASRHSGEQLNNAARGAASAVLTGWCCSLPAAVWPLGPERADVSSVFKRKSLTKSSVSRSPAHGGEILGSSVLQGSNVERKRSRDLVLKVIDFVNADDKNSGRSQLLYRCSTSVSSIICWVLFEMLPPSALKGFLVAVLTADVIYSRINVAVLTSDFNRNICRMIVEEISGEASNERTFLVCWKAVVLSWI